MNDNPLTPARIDWKSLAVCIAVMILEYLVFTHWAIPYGNGATR